MIEGRVGLWRFINADNAKIMENWLPGVFLDLNKIAILLIGEGIKAEEP